MFISSCLRSRKSFHLHFIKLMHSDNTFYIFSICSSFSSKCCRISYHTNRQFFFFKHTVHIHRSHSMFCTSYQNLFIFMKTISFIHRMQSSHLFHNTHTHNNRRKNRNKGSIFYSKFSFFDYLLNNS